MSKKADCCPHCKSDKGWALREVQITITRGKIGSYFEDIKNLKTTRRTRRGNIKCLNCKRIVKT